MAAATYGSPAVAASAVAVSDAGAGAVPASAASRRMAAARSELMIRSYGLTALRSATGSHPSRSSFGALTSWSSDLNVTPCGPSRVASSKSSLLSATAGVARRVVAARSRASSSVFLPATTASTVSRVVLEAQLASGRPALSAPEISVLIRAPRSSLQLRARSPRPPRFRGRSTNVALAQARLLEVQVALDQALDILGDLALVAQPEHRRALGLDQLAPQVGVAQALVVDGVGRLLATEDRDALAKARAVEVAQPPQRLVARALLVFELVKPVERRLRRLQARDRLLRAPLARARQLQGADQPGQRQPLADECHEDHHEGEEDHLRAVVDARGDRERGRQRDRPAHPAPADDEALAQRQPRRERRQREDDPHD